MREVMLTGGTVITMAGRTPRTEAILWHSNRIVAAGETAAIRAMAGVGALEIDLDGRTVVPGFNDAHIHLSLLGDRSDSLSLAGMTKTEIVECVAEMDRELEEKEPLIAYNWDFPTCPDPHRSDLDRVIRERPVVLLQFSGHGAWLNTAALDYLRITPERSEWEMGGAEKDSAGALTGVVRELGQAPGVRRLQMRVMVNRSKIRSSYRGAFAELARFGITSAQDNTWLPWAVSELAAARRDGGLSCRVSCWSAGFMPALDLLFSMRRFDPEWYAKGPRKYLLDGAFSSRSAWLSEPYADRPDHMGAGLPARRIESFLRRANRQTRQIACHSIGDAATAAYLDAVEMTGPDAAARLRHRIEHGQLIAQRDIERIARFGMVVSAQPHAAADPEKDERLLGTDRARRAYPFRKLLDAGIPVAFGSDYPGEATYDPIFGIHLAVNREGGQAISAAEAIRCYTASSAWAECREAEKGRIEAGFLCDLAVLSDDPTQIDPARIKEIKVDATIVDGEIVYERVPGALGRAPHRSELHQRTSHRNASRQNASPRNGSRVAAR